MSNCDKLKNNEVQPTGVLIFYPNVTLGGHFFVLAHLQTCLGDLTLEKISLPKPFPLTLNCTNYILIFNFIIGGPGRMTCGQYLDLRLPISENLHFWMAPKSVSS